MHEVHEHTSAHSPVNGGVGAVGPRWDGRRVARCTDSCADWQASQTPHYCAPAGLESVTLPQLTPVAPTDSSDHPQPLSAPNCQARRVWRTQFRAISSAETGPGVSPRPVYSRTSRRRGGSYSKLSLLLPDTLIIRSTRWESEYTTARTHR